MDFRFSDEQRMLDESATRFLADTFPFDVYRAAIEGTSGFDAVRRRRHEHCRNHTANQCEPARQG